MLLKMTTALKWFRLIGVSLYCTLLLVACDGNPLLSSSPKPPATNAPGSSPTPVALPTVLSKGPDVALPPGPSIIVTPTPLPTSTTVAEPTPVSSALTPSVQPTGTPVPLQVSTRTLSTGTVGSTYSQILQANGGAGSYTWTQDSGQIPPGLSLDGKTGEIKGTPLQRGEFNFVAKVTDESAQSATQSLFLAIFDDNNVNLAIASTFLDPGQVEKAYDKTLLVTGGTAPYSWSIQSGALPPGLSLLNSSGQVKGTPTTSGSFTFTIKATDAKGAVATRDFTGSSALTINKTGATITITTTTLPVGRLNKVYGSCPCNTNCSGSTIFSATGGTNSFSTWSVISGALPSGLSLNSTTGALSGTPTQIGSFAFTLQAIDSAGNAGTKSFVIKVAKMTISSFTPTSGGHGVSMTIKGDNFSAVLADNKVKIGGILLPGANVGPVDVSVVDCHTLTVKVPIAVTTGVVAVERPDPDSPATTTLTGASIDLFTANENEVVIHEVFLREAADPNNTQFIELRNMGSRGTINIGSWTLQYTGKATGNPQVYTIPANTQIAQGAIITVKVRFGDPLNNNATTLFTGLGLEAMRLDNALFTEVSLCADAACTADSIRDYVSFTAASGSAFQTSAATAQLWTAGTFVKRASTDVQAANTDDGTNLGLHVVSNANFAVGDVVEVNNVIRTVLGLQTTSGQPRLLLNDKVLPVPVSVNIGYPKSLHFKGSGNTNKDYFFGSSTEGSTTLPAQ